MNEQEQILKELKVAMVRMVNEQSDLVVHRDNLKKENKELRKLVQQWELENKVLQESLEQCQRDLLEVEDAHAFKFTIPESWIIKDEED